MIGDGRAPEGGIQLGRYRLMERIGSGGMAEVFRARTEGAQGFVRDVCVKRILPAFAGEGEFVRMFVHEAQVTSRLHHANIAQVFDFAEHEGVHFLVMELVDGPDLRKLLASLAAAHRAMPLEVALLVTLEILEALHYAHGRTEPDGRALDLVHRDISPHNVLVSYAGEVKLTDFGIAKARTLGLRTKTGQIKGKLAYMAPEQALGRAVDARTDLWATGVVLFEMLAGERPFHASTDVELSAAIVSGRVPNLRRWRPHLPPPIERAIAQLLSADPGRRPPSAEHALGALREASREAGVAPATAHDLAALVTSAVPRSRGHVSAHPPRDATEVQPDAPAAFRPAPPDYRVAGPADPTRTFTPPADPYDATAPRGRARAEAGFAAAEDTPAFRGSLTAIDPAPAGAAVLVVGDGGPVELAAAAASDTGGLVAQRLAAPLPVAPLPVVSSYARETPVATVAAPPPPQVRAVAAAAAALRPSESTWTAGAAPPAPREASWTPILPPPPSERPPGPSRRPPARPPRKPLTRRPLFLVIAFLGFLVLGVVGGASVWYVLRGRRLRRPVRRAPAPAQTACAASPRPSSSSDAVRSG